MNRIKQLRKKTNDSLRELSEKTNINYVTLSRMENGTQPLSDQYLIILRNYFKVSIDYILGLEDIPKPSEKKQHSQKHERMMHYVSLLSESDIELVESIVTKLLDKDNINYSEVQKSKTIYK